MGEFDYLDSLLILGVLQMEDFLIKECSYGKENAEADAAIEMTVKSLGKEMEGFK